MKTYVVSGWYDDYGRDCVEILYVGQDEQKCFNVDVSKYANAEIEVWESNTRKSLYYWNSRNNTWDLQYGMR